MLFWLLFVYWDAQIYFSRVIVFTVKTVVSCANNINSMLFMAGQFGWDCPFGPLLFTSSFGHSTYNYANTDVMTWCSFIIQTCSKILLGWEKGFIYGSCLSVSMLWFIFHHVRDCIVDWVRCLQRLIADLPFHCFLLIGGKKLIYQKKISILFFFAQHRFLCGLLFWILV